MGSSSEALAMEGRLMNFLSKFWQWIRQAKIESWQATDKTLTEATRPQGKDSPGSYVDKSQAGDTYKGIKVTLPLPEGAD